MKRLLLSTLLALLFVLVPTTAILAATDADVTVTYTVEYLDITDNVTTIDFGTVSTSTTADTTTSHVGITNSSSVQTDATIGVTGSTWTGGTAHTHSDTATPGADTVGLKANRGGTWGAGDVIVKYNATWNYIYEDCPATTDFDYGLKLWTPTSTSDGVEKTNTVRVTIVAG